MIITMLALAAFGGIVFIGLLVFFIHALMTAPILDEPEAPWPAEETRAAQDRRKILDAAGRAFGGEAPNEAELKLYPANGNRGPRGKGNHDVRPL